MKVRTLEGDIAEILGSNEIKVDNKTLRLKKWFAEKYREELEKLKECKIEKETNKAILIINEKNMMWIPKSVIENLQEVSEE